MRSGAWRPNSRRWEVAEAFDGAAELGRRLGVAPLVVQVLHNRGVRTEEQARSFLQPKLTDLHDPLALAGVETAAQRIAQAVARREKITIYGDYDVDGMTAVAILHSCLKLLGCPADYYVPHRLEEGYGVNAEAIRKIVATGCKLLITVDCGISAAEALAEATGAGVDVIVTDHHSLAEELPKAVAVVHPCLGAGETAYPNPDLSGAGVAFKLAWQIARQVTGKTRLDAPARDFLLDATCLAALGTIADVVPLVGENRILAVYGLRALPASKHPGLKALLESADLKKNIDAEHVGFILGPRLNACGRMGHARLAVELLTGEAPHRCQEIAAYLSEQNVQRQKIEKEIAEQAAQMVVDQHLDDPANRAIVLASDSWHNGVIGIVAARLVERFHRPTILLAIQKDSCAHGSGQSIPGFHMRDALAACGQYLLSFGGHAMAGGVKIEPHRIAAFAEAMREYAAGHVLPQQLTPPVHIDAESSLAALSYPAVEHLGRLAPFGQGNPPPTVALRRCKLLAEPRRMGKSGTTISLYLGQNGASLRAVGFNMGDLVEHLTGASYIDVAAQPALNEFNGSTTVELRLKDVVRSPST